MSMAAGEFVSVHSQADTEKADLARERGTHIRADDEGEREELSVIYIARGLDPSRAKQVADQLMAHDAIGAHARDELGISEALRARPVQSAFASAGCFAVGAAMPLIVSALAPAATLIIFVGVSNQTTVEPRPNAWRRRPAGLDGIRQPGPVTVNSAVCTISSGQSAITTRFRITAKVAASFAMISGREMCPVCKTGSTWSATQDSGSALGSAAKMGLLSDPQARAPAKSVARQPR